MFSSSTKFSFLGCRACALSYRSTINCARNAASTMAFIWEKAKCVRFTAFKSTVTIYDLHKQQNLQVTDWFITGLTNLMKQETCQDKNHQKDHRLQKNMLNTKRTVHTQSDDMYLTQFATWYTHWHKMCWSGWHSFLPKYNCDKKSKGGLNIQNFMLNEIYEGK
jgi:hypothetical protein